MKFCKEINYPFYFTCVWFPGFLRAVQDRYLTVINYGQVFNIQQLNDLRGISVHIKLKDMSTISNVYIIYIPKVKLIMFAIFRGLSLVTFAILLEGYTFISSKVKKGYIA